MPTTILPLLVVVDDSTECWGWIGRHDKHGYSIWSKGHTTHRVHRLTYETLVGPIPDGLEIDHLCRNPGCVNPSHLEPVTHDENLRRARVAKGWPLTHCKSGHPWVPENIYTRPNGEHECRVCARERTRSWKAAKRRGETTREKDGSDEPSRHSSQESS